MSFRLVFQDGGGETPTLLEALLSASVEARRGAAAFAFASGAGVRLLLEDALFGEFLSTSSFDLVVGVDAVTTRDALRQLSIAERRFPEFQARVFWHGRRDALFHPKVGWFAHDRSGIALVGSGNLTRGGLLKNWEAYGQARVADADLEAAVHSWEAWSRRNRAAWRALDDPAVLRRAERNERARRRLHEEDEVERADRDLDGGADEGRGAVLIAEVSRGREGQVDVGKDLFQSFFQLAVPKDRTQRVTLIPVNESGDVGEPEVKPPVLKESSNYCLEVGLARQRRRPAEGRPIGVYLRIGARRFRYRFLMPGDPQHEALTEWLAARAPAAASRMRRNVTSEADFRSTFPRFAI